MYERKIEKHSSDFINNIVQKSYDIIQKKPLFLMLKGIFQDLSLPSPQYALSFIFIVGLAMSLLTSETVAYDLIDDIYIQGDFIYE